MTKKKILIFAPYGFWNVHHQLDAVLGAALRLRGCEIAVLGCDGIFENCPIGGGPPNRQICKNCEKAGVNLFSAFNIPVTHMGSLLKEQDIQECRDWVNQLDVEDLRNAVFEEGEVGKWVYASVLMYFLTSHLDYSKPEVSEMYKQCLYNATILQRIYRQFLDSFYAFLFILFIGLLYCNLYKSNDPLN